MSFGHSFRDEHFTVLEKGVLNVNHGSYGLIPKLVFNKYIESIKKEYAFPDRFFQEEILPEFEAAATLVAEKYYHCDPHHVAFVQNATIGVNAVIKLLKFSKGDRIVIADTIYGACHNALKFLVKRSGVVLEVINLDYPMEDDAVVDLWDKKLPGARLALFDAITLMPGVIFPYQQITKLCHKYQVISLIDGAHAIGQIKLDLGSLKPDFFVSNLHKWLNVPRGCAALYVNPRFFAEIQTLPVSHSYVDEDISATPLTLWTKFFFVGTNNYGSIPAISEAIKFREEVCGGEDNIAQYCRALNELLQQLISEKWPFALLVENSTKTLIPYGMVTYWLPIQKFIDHFDIPVKLDYANPVQLEKFRLGVDHLMHYTYKSRFPFAFVGDRVILRFSTQIYNELLDYDYATDMWVEAWKRQWLDSKL